jgi:hypothetical protein
MDDILYSLTVMGIAILIGLLFSGYSYFIIYQYSSFAYTDLELNDQAQTTIY